MALVACGGDSGTSANDGKDSELAEVSSSSKAVSSSSSVIPASSGNLPSSSSKKVESSSSQKTASSSSLNNDISSGVEYKPYAHDTCLAGNWNIEKSVYKRFTNTRNGRSYNNDTTNCDKYGGLYQWAEMMQLPSSCNTESCYKKIRRDHRGICPEGWRLFTWSDYEIIRDYNDKYGDGIKGLRSQCFHGNNASGFSLIGTGRRTIDGEFDGLNESVYWVYPQEHGYDVAEYANAAYVLSGVNDNTGTAKNRRAEKLGGRPVRCTKIE